MKYEYAGEPTAQKAAMNLGISNLRAAPQSPIQELLARLASAVESAHTGMSVLTDKLAPITLPTMPGEGSKDKGMAMPPSEVEQHLFRLLTDIESLTARMGRAHDDLRI